MGGMLIIQLLSLALIPFYLKYLSLSDYGYWLVISSIIGWIGLADFGIGFAVTRFFIKAVSGVKENSTVNQVANTSLFLFLIVSIFFLVIGVSVAPFFKQWFHIDDIVFKTFSIAFLITLVNSTIMIPFAMFSGILEAKQKIALNRNIQTLSLITQFISSIAFVLIYKSIIGLALSLLAGTLVSCVLLVFFASREMSFKISLAQINKKLLKEIFTFGGYFQVGRTANTIATSTDNLFIASYLDAGKIPVYSFTSRLPVLFCNSIASKVPTSLFSGLSQVFDQGENVLFKTSFKKLFSIMLRLAYFASIMIFFVNEKFVGLWVGKSNYGGNTLNIIFVYWVFFETMIRGTGIVIHIFGDLRMWAISSVVESIINIGLSFYFLYSGLGIIGLALATAIARTLTLGIYWAWFLDNKQLLIFKEMMIAFLKNLLVNIPLLIILYCLSRIIHFENEVFTIAMYIVAGTLINIVCYDWKILKTAFQQRSVSSIYHSYMKKY